MDYVGVPRGESCNDTGSIGVQRGEGFHVCLSQREISVSFNPKEFFFREHRADLDSATPRRVAFRDS